MLPFLKVLSEIGIILFMFLIGLELDPGLLRRRGRVAAVISATGIAVPFALGAATALVLYPAYAGPAASAAGFAIFLGAAMAITAFPVLARILEERRMMKTNVGATAIACAATDDVTAWSVLAFVVAIVKAGGLAASLLTLGLVVLFVALMLFGLKPRMPRWLGQADTAAGAPGKGVIAAVLV